MDNEDFVRTTWEKVRKSWKDNDSYAPDLIILEVGNRNFSDPKYDVVWKEAADYTIEVLQEFKQYREAQEAIRDLKEDPRGYLCSLLLKRFQETFHLLKEEILNA